MVRTLNLRGRGRRGERLYELNEGVLHDGYMSLSQNATYASQLTSPTSSGKVYRGILMGI